MTQKISSYYTAVPANPKKFLPLLQIIGLIVIVWAALNAHHAFERLSNDGYKWLAVAGGVLLILAPPAVTVPHSDEWQLEIRQGRRRTIGVSLLIMGAVFFLISSNLFWQVDIEAIADATPWLPFLIGLGCWMVGAVLLASPGKFSMPTIPLALVYIVAIAIALRTYDLANRPYGLWYDETNSALISQRILHEPDYRPQFLVEQGTGSLPHYLNAALLAIFGENKMTPLRLMSVAFDVGSVIVGYALGNQLRGRWFGLLMALFLATMRWSINFSRNAMPLVEVNFFTLLTFFFLYRMMRHGKLANAFLAGAAIGTGIWFYIAFRSALVAQAIFVLIAWRKWRSFPQTIMLFATVAATALIFSLPMTLYILKQPDDFLQRTREVSISNPQNRENLPLKEAIQQNAEYHLRMFHIQGDFNGRHNLSGEPMLDPLTGILFGIGLIFALREWRRPETLFFVALSAIALASGIFTLLFEAPQSLRSIGIIPAVAYFAALGAFQAGNLLVQAIKPLRLSQTPVLWAGGLLLAGYITHFNADVYFNKQTLDPRTWSDFMGEETAMARIVTAQPPGTTFFFSPYLAGSLSVEFLYPGTFRDWQTLQLPDPFQQIQQANTPISIFFHPTDEGLVQYARELYPNARFLAVRRNNYGIDDDGILFYQLDLTRQDLDSIAGLEAGEGVLIITTYGDYEFSMSPNTTLTINGQIIQPRQPVRLAVGNHNIQLDPPGAALEWHTPSSEGFDLLPPTALYHHPVNANGLHARLYPNADWSGDPVLERIDRQIATMFHITWLEPRPYTVEWTGQLVPPAGKYQLAIDVAQSAEVWLDGKRILVSQAPRVRTSIPLWLEARPYDLRIRFLDSENNSQVYFLWKPLGEEEFVPVPPEVLRPFP